MHRNVTRTIAALGVAGAIAVGLTTPTMAQGIYFGGPGVSVGIGDGYGWRHHRGYYRDYGYYDHRPYRHYGYRYYDGW